MHRTYRFYFKTGLPFIIQKSERTACVPAQLVKNKEENDIMMTVLFIYYFAIILSGDNIAVNVKSDNK